MGAPRSAASDPPRRRGRLSPGAECRVDGQLPRSSGPARGRLERNSSPPPKREHPAMRVLRLHEVVQLCGLRKSTIYLMVRAGQFPAPIKLTPTGRAVGWRSDQLQSWIQSGPPLSRPGAGPMHAMKRSSRRAGLPRWIPSPSPRPKSPASGRCWATTLAARLPTTKFYATRWRNGRGSGLVPTWNRPPPSGKTSRPVARYRGFILPFPRGPQPGASAMGPRVPSAGRTCEGHTRGCPFVTTDG